VCPVIDFVDETGGTFAPNTVFNAAVSAPSFAWVEVPCAFT
jgi:hypothetical protein